VFKDYGDLPGTCADPLAIRGSGDDMAGQSAKYGAKTYTQGEEDPAGGRAVRRSGGRHMNVVTLPDTNAFGRYTLALPPVRTAPRLARQLAICALTGWGLQDLIDGVTLIVSELATNSALHAGELALSLFQDGGDLVIEMWDSSNEPPEQQDEDLGSLHGRGLVLVGAIAGDWGWHPVRNGKITWARMKADPPPPGM
jgi:anti-sigma regulatory factor (Ser/Thr protein kinase)